MMRRLWHPLISAWAAATMVTGGCRTPAPSTPVKLAPPAEAAAVTSSGRAQVAIDPAAADGQILAVEASAGGAEAAVGAVQELTADQTRALVARMAPLPDLAAENARAKTLRPPTAPPPRGGEARPIELAFATGKPAAQAPVRPARPTTPLAAPEITPAGEVDRESEIRVRFAEPMVPVAEVGTPAQPVATLAPAVAGTWRWIDTRVATFTASGARLPQATEIKVTVPAGTRAASGATLRAEASGGFSTAPIAIASAYPTSTIRADSPIAVELDQGFDEKKLLPFVRVVRVKGEEPVPVRAMTLAEARKLWAKNPSLNVDDERAKALDDGRHLVLAPRTTWPAGQELEVVLRPGAPSAEGPRLSTEESFQRFDVAPAFRVLGIACGDDGRARLSARCPADSWLSVELSNPIATESYRADKIHIDGVPAEDNRPSGSTVGLSVPPAVGRRYTISVGSGIVDEYGQALAVPPALSFVTGPEKFQASLIANQGMQVLDPRFEIPQWVISTAAVASLRVQLYQVQPSDFFAYGRVEDSPRAMPPGKKVFDQTYPVGPHHEVNARVDLRPALSRTGVGHVVALATVTPTAGGEAPGRRLAWIQVTRLGVSARVDGERVNAWVQDITPRDRFLAPIAGASVSLLGEGGGTAPAATSDAAGHAAVELLARRARKDDAGRGGAPALLEARAGDDSTFAVVSASEKSLRVENALWYVTDDRFIYKPGEKLYVKGWVRWTHNGTNPDLALPRGGETVAYQLDDAQGNKLAAGQAALSDQGGFHLELDLPKNANLGTASLSLVTRGDEYRHPISIQEFRTPAYSVSLDEDVAFGGALPVILGDSLDMTATARYYAGGGLGGAPVQWKATLVTAPFDPPGWDRFTFDPPYPRSQGRWDSRRESKNAEAELTSALSGASSSTVSWGVSALPGGRPSVLEVDAVVTDVDRMSIRASSRPILVHPSAYYVGLRLRPGATDALEAVVTDVDGKPVTGVAIAVAIEGVLGSESERDDAKVIDTQSCQLVSAAQPVACPFTRKDANTAYRARARIADRRGRANAAQLDVPWWSPDDRDDLSVVPDKAMYRPGDVARLSIRSKVLPATAVVSFARQGVVSQRRIELTGAATPVDLPIDAAFVPDVHVVVDRYARRQNTQKGSALPLPEPSYVEIDLPVDLASARLSMRAWPSRKLIEPGDEATFEASVEHDGQPVAGAEVALMVVDEAVLALAAKSHADPLEPFYHRLRHGTQAVTTLDLVVDSGDELAGDPGVTRDDLRGRGLYGTLGSGSGGGEGYGIGSGSGGMRGRSAVVESRKDFRPNALFAPLLHTDAQGHVSVTVKMPDNLTRYRVVALATAGGRWFGKAESAIVAQRKVNARTVAPRFLTQGDRFSLPVVVQNLDTAPRTVDIAVRAANLVASGPAGKRVTVPAGQRAEVRFDLATLERGRAVVQTIAVSGDLADASDVSIPVYEPATTEAFATYGVVDDAPQLEQLVVPASLFPDVGGVEVELASTQLMSLTDAYTYLYRYPYECAEQRSGRMLATAALHDLLDAFAAPGRPAPSEIEAQRARDAAVLERDQRPDGGWGWFGGLSSDPFVSQQVLAALAAQQIGGKVKTAAVAYVNKETATALAKLEKAAASPAGRRQGRDEQTFQVSLSAAMLGALAVAGSDVGARAIQLDRLATTLGAYPIDAKARLLALVAGARKAREMRARLLAALLSAAHETAAAATVTTGAIEAERLLLPSDNRTTALALDALMREAPDHPLVAKLARGVLDGRRQGRWRTTQENLVALQALRRFFDTYEKVTPDYTGRVWLGSAGYLEQAFAGRSAARAVAAVGWSQLAPGTTHDLAVAKQGPGRLYYRVGITYAPRQVDLPALDAGFIVRRGWSAEDPADLVATADGYRVRLGAKLQVTLEVLATTPRHAVALVDPLPAGFETVNASLATAERTLAADDSTWDHVNLRDDRAEAFRMRLEAGTYRFSYTVRATTPGAFIVAPAKAEEMYSPETFGRSTGLRVTVE